MLAAETILGAYMFHRHGDRTPKALKPANLTDLGYQQVYQSGQYYRNRYVAADADFKIAGLNTDIVKQSQLSVTAPSDTVLQNSATGFLQGLYPPVGSDVTTETLRNGSSVSAPLDGYQLIPVGTTSTGAGSEDAGWLQDTSDCGAAETSSNNYFLSAEYAAALDGTRDFYQALLPVVNATFDADYLSFKNAYVGPYHLPSPPSPLPSLTTPTSIRPHQRRHHPQHLHPLLLPPHQRHPPPTPHPRRRPRMGPRLQRDRRHARRRRHAARRRSAGAPQQQHHVAQQLSQTRRAIRRLRHLRLLLRPRRAARREPRLPRRHRLRVEHGVRAVHPREREQRCRRCGRERFVCPVPVS
ncbi:hypothetical protein SLS55_003791 [Diplodia seriata]|uniref:Phosphoglycerate mutase-like protein n=1 Tax=Diplodia seriata TaxID=420778 RepID=A0ABR3CP09_9PEZI